MERAILPRALAGILALGLWLALDGPARAQDAPDATLATSREVTFYLPAEGQIASSAISREVTFYLPPDGQQATSGVSREVSLFIPPGAIATLADSREITVRFRYTLKDVRNALQIAAGVQPAPATGSWDYNWLNASKSPPSATVIDILDAIVEAYSATHP